MTHVLGLITLGSIVITTLVTARVLWVTGTRTYSWLRLPRAPRLARVTPSSPPGPAGFSDYVGPL